MLHSFATKWVIRLFSVYWKDRSIIFILSTWSHAQERKCWTRAGTRPAEDGLIPMHALALNDASIVPCDHTHMLDLQCWLRAALLDECILFSCIWILKLLRSGDWISPQVWQALIQMKFKVFAYKECENCSSNHQVKRWILVWKQRG